MRNYLLICVSLFIAISSISCSNSAGKEVDLGLSVNWAECNLGASSPEEYGDYYAWGELMSKEVFTRDNYSYIFTESGEYILHEDIGGNNGLDPAKDNWDNGWRMPTSSEIKELIEQCTFTCDTYNGVKGIKVVGPNGNSIFLPTGGHMEDSNCLGPIGATTEFPFEYDYGYYWSGSLNNYWASQGEINKDFPLVLSIRHRQDEDDFNAEILSHSMLPFYGCTIRPVKAK